MTREQLVRIEKLFDLIVGLPSGDQISELDKLCPDDRAVNAQVARLLKAAAEKTNSQERGVADRLRKGAALIAEVCDDLPIGSNFTDYVILEALPKGGFGSVYKVAERTDVSRIVALKVIKAGFDTREVLARFANERQVLANMSHPNIAKLFRAGTTDKGRPYFIMEYVPEVPITDFADQNELSIPDRLKLFQQVCEAISHAHQKAVIHRDIKAANILAYMCDGKPTVKVIDFGIAKALTGDRLMAHSIVSTQRNAVIGSYESMSPEQAAGSPDIDTLTDVYSLGVVLYELLVGVKPFSSATLDEAGDTQARKIIEERPPARPSTRLSTIGPAVSKVAAARKTRPDDLARELRTELEWIPLQALRKERRSRYATPLALSADIHNYLNHIPLEAGPPSFGYHARKFIRRHRTAFLTTALFLIAAVAGVGAYIHGLGIEQSKTRNALGFANSQKTLAQAAEIRTSGLLAEAKEINRVLAGDKHLAAQLNHTIPALNLGGQGLGDVIDFLRDLTGYVIVIDWPSINERGIDKDAPIFVTLSNTPFDQCLDAILESAAPASVVSWVIKDDGTIFVAAQPVVAEIVVTVGVDLVPIADKPAELEAMTQRIQAILGHRDGQILQGAGMIWVRAPIEKQQQIVRVYRNSGFKPVSRKGSYDRDPTMEAHAQPNPRQRTNTPTVAQNASTQPGHLPLSTITFMENSLHDDIVAKISLQHGDLETAERKYRSAIEARRKLRPAERVELAIVLDDLVAVLISADKISEAEPMCREAIEIFRQELPKRGRELSVSLTHLAELLLAQDQVEEAEAVAQEASRHRQFDRLG